MFGCRARKMRVLFVLLLSTSGIAFRFTRSPTSLFTQSRHNSGDRQSTEIVPPLRAEGLILPDDPRFEQDLEEVGANVGIVATQAPSQPKTAAEARLQENLAALQDKLSLAGKQGDSSGFGIVAVSGRPNEVIYSTNAPDPQQLEFWAETLVSKGITRVIALFEDGEEDTFPSPGYRATLSAAGISGDDVSVISMTSDGAVERIQNLLEQAKAEATKLAVHGFRGAGQGSESAKRSTLVMGQYIMGDYDADPEEAIECLKARAHHTGTSLVPFMEDLEKWTTNLQLTEEEPEFYQDAEPPTSSGLLL